MPSHLPTVHWLELPDDSQLVMQGLPSEAPVISFDKAQTIFSSSAHMLSELVGDIKTEVVFTHDTDWDQFPEVAEATKQAGCEENCLTIASCAGAGKWAVGLGSGWKGRESASRLALCVALTAGTPKMADLGRSYPEFRQLCAGAGILQSAAPASAPASKGGFGGPPAGKAATSRRQSYGRAPVESLGFDEQEFEAAAAMYNVTAPELAEPQEAFDPEAAPQLATASAAAGPAPTIHWLAITQQSRITEAGLPADAPAICHDKEYNESFMNAHRMLTDLVGDVSVEVVFDHDTDWNLFPEVVAGLKQAGAEENCFCVATCANFCKWAVGVGSGWKGRETAAKLALAVALTAGTEKLEELAKDYPEFCTLCANAGLVDAPVPPPAKKFKAGW